MVVFLDLDDTLMTHTSAIRSGVDKLRQTLEIETPLAAKDESSR